MPDQITEKLDADKPPNKAAFAGCAPWAGLYNTYFWIDFRRKITAVFLAQIKPFADPAILAALFAFERAIYASDRVSR